MTKNRKTFHGVAASALFVFIGPGWAHDGTVPGGASLVVRTNEAIDVRDAGFPIQSTKTREEG